MLIGFLIPSFAFAQYTGGVEFYHLPLTVDSKQYSVLAQSNTNHFTGATYDNEAGSLIFSTTSSDDFIDTYAITMNEKTFSELLVTDHAKTPDSMLILINGVKQPYKTFKEDEIVSWRFYVTTSSYEVELLPSTPMFDTGIYEFDKVPNGTLKIYPPLKQDHVGVVAENIQCKQNLILLQKYDGSSACVKSSTAEKLVERGWTNTKPDIHVLKYSPVLFIGTGVDLPENELMNHLKDKREQLHMAFDEVGAKGLYPIVGMSFSIGNNAYSLDEKYVGNPVALEIRVLKEEFTKETLEKINELVRKHVGDKIDVVYSKGAYAFPTPMEE